MKWNGTNGERMMDIVTDVACALVREAADQLVSCLLDAVFSGLL